MSLGLYLALDQSVIYRNDFTDVDALRLTGTIYSDILTSTAFDLTGYTLTLQFYREWGRTDFLNQTLTIDTAADGTFYLEPAEGKIPTADIYLATVELSKSGTKIHTINRVEVLVKDGPRA